MNHKPIKYTEWLSSRREFMARIGWLSIKPGLYSTYSTSNYAFYRARDFAFEEEYRAMLIALKKDCTVRGIAYTLGSTYSTIMKDRQFLGITALTRGGTQVPPRLFSHNNKMMTCQQVADLNGCCYATAYARLTIGRWIA